MQRKDPQKAADYVGSVLKGEICVSGFISLCHPQHLVADVLCDFLKTTNRVERWLVFSCFSELRLVECLLSVGEGKR